MTEQLLNPNPTGPSVDTQYAMIDNEAQFLDLVFKSCFSPVSNDSLFEALKIVSIIVINGKIIGVEYTMEFKPDYEKSLHLRGNIIEFSQLLDDKKSVLPDDTYSYVYSAFIDMQYNFINDAVHTCIANAHHGTRNTVNNLAAILSMLCEQGTANIYAPPIEKTDFPFFVEAINICRTQMNDRGSQEDIDERNSLTIVAQYTYKMVLDMCSHLSSELVESLLKYRPYLLYETEYGESIGSIHPNTLSIEEMRKLYKSRCRSGSSGVPKGWDRPRGLKGMNGF